MAIDYGKILGLLKNAVTSTVKVAAQDFLNQHQDAADFLESQSEDLAQLGVDYLKAPNDDARAKIQFQIDLVTQSVRNKMASIALDAEAAAKEAFTNILQTALGVVIKVLPVVLAAL